MTAITQEEFDRIVHEMTAEKPARYDTLCAVAERLLWRKLERRVASTPALARCCTAEDLLSEVYIRLIKCTIPNFLYRDDTLNNDPEGFARWVYTVAGNICRDKCRSAAARQTVALDADPDDEDAPYLQIADPDAELPFEVDESTDMLRAAFERVLDMDVQVYKIITWAAQAVLILSADELKDIPLKEEAESLGSLAKAQASGVTKIQSNELMIRAYEHMTLSEMWASVTAASARIPWLKISTAADDRLRKMLAAPFSKDVRYGDMVYADFFMKKGAKASISDWVNRINSGLKEKLR